MATLYQLQEGLFSAKDAGDTERQKKISDAIRKHPTFQKQSQQKLSQGFKALDGDERKAEIHKHTARSLGIHENDLDSERGMGGIGRIQFKALPRPEDKLEFLTKTYGRENLNVANIAGQDQFLYRDEAETGGKWRRVDEEGISLADWTSDLVGLAPEIGGAVAGAIKGGAAGTAVLPGWGTAAGAVIGAAGGGFAGGVAGDVTARASAGQDIDITESAMRRLGEVPLNMALDTATLGVGKFIGKPLLKAAGKTPAAKQIMDSMQSLKVKYGLAFEETPDVTKGMKARTKAGRLAGETGGSLSRAKQSNIDEIGRASRVVDGIEEPITSALAIQRIQNSVREAYKSNISKSEQIGNKITEAYNIRFKSSSEALQYQLDNEVAGLRVPREFNPEISAENFRAAMLGQRGRVADASRAKFEKGLSNMEGASIPAAKLERKLGNTVDSLAGVVSDDALVTGLSASKVTQLGKSVTKLEEMAEAGEMIPFRSLHNLKKSLDDASGYGAAQPSDNQLAARRAAGKVREIIDESLAGAGVRGKAYKDANKFFQERMTPFRTKAIAPVLASDIAPGTFKETGEKLARKVVSDPEYVRQILKNAGGTKAAVKKEMAQMYMDAIGTSFDFNPRIANQLFDDGVVESLQRIRSLKNRLKIPARNIKEGDVQAMVKGMSGKARKEAEKALEAKLKADARASDLIKSNKLIAKMANGKQPMPWNPRDFADDLLKESPETITDFVKRIESDPEALAELRSGVVENFRSAIKSGGEGSQRTSIKAGEVPLWKAGDVEKLLNSPKGTNFKAAMGEDWAKDWIDLDRALKGSEITGVPIKEQIRGVFTTGTGILIVAAGIPKWIYGRAMNALGGSKLMRPFLRNVEKDPAMMQKLIPYLFSTSEGIEALLEEGKHDPEFAEFVDQQLAQSQQEPEN